MLPLIGCGRIGFGTIDGDAATDARQLVPGGTIFAGDDHACRRDGTQLSCWGQNDHSQVQPTPMDVLAPTPVATSARWIDAALGQNHSCALDDAGAIWCWGEELNGQLGLSPPACGDLDLDGAELCDDGNTANGDGCNAHCSDTVAVPPDATSPTMHVDGRRYRRLSASDFSACAIALDDTLWCWGRNLDGNLGVGDTVDRGRPAQVVMTDSARDTQWLDIAVGDHHTCGLQRDATLWCWGDGSVGALGQGPIGPLSTPGRVPGDRMWKRLQSGGYHTCAIDDADTLWCWGDNSQGQLGVGDTIRRDTPVAVGTGPWRDLGLGLDHSCAIRDGGAAFCWGDNDNGQTGIGVPSPSENAPAPITGTWSDIESGDGFSCGIALDGTGWCWGLQVSGRLGNGQMTGQANAPVQIF